MADITFKSISSDDSRKQSCTILQGTSSTLVIEPTDSDNNPISTTGYTLLGQFKTSFDAPNAVLTFSTSNGNVVNETGSNRFRIAFTAEATSRLRFTGESLRGVYEFELTAPDGTKTKLLYGTFTLMREVTA